MELTFYEVTLKKLALVSCALAFWRKDDIQLKLKQFYYPYNRRGKKEFLVILIKEVIKKVNSESLPPILHAELVLAIKDIAFKKSNWFFYLRRRKAFRNIPRKELYDKFFKDVYFTHYGTIDELKILKSWMRIPDVDYGILYVKACYYCEEELINDIWGKISEQQLQFYSYEHLCKRFGFHLVAYWNKLRENDLDTFYTDCVVPNAGFDGSFYDDTQSVEVNLLRLSVRKGYVRAVKYFGNKISKEDMRRNVEFCLSFIFDMSNETNESQFYRKEQFTEIALYLSTFLTDKMKRTVFTEMNMSNSVFAPRDNVKYLKPFLDMFILMWPWQGCFEYVLNSVKNLLDKEHLKSVFHSVITEADDSSGFGIPYENSVFQSQIHRLWNSIPDEWKSFIVDNTAIQFLFSCDVKSCKQILNHEQMVEQKKKKIKILCKNHLEQSEMKKEELKVFINKILFLWDWDDSDQDIVRNLYGYIMDGDFDSISDLFIVLSPGKIKYFKKKIDHKLMCYYLITNNEYELCTKFLNWKFDENAVKVIEFKKKFCDDDFAEAHIYYLWGTCNGNAEWAKMNSDKFLSWFLDTKIEILAFKVKHLAKPRFYNDIFHFDFHPFDKDKNFEVLENFIDWCSLNKEAFLQIKQYFIDMHLPYKISHFVKENSMESADQLLKWAFSDSEEEKKIAFMRELWTNAGLFERENNRMILMCKLFIGKYWHYDIFRPEPTREEVAETFKKFIRFFIKPYVENIGDLKRILKRWPKVSKNIFEIIDADAPSTEEYYSECSEDYEDSETFMYCEKENCQLFLELLKNEYT